MMRKNITILNCTDHDVVVENRFTNQTFTYYPTNMVARVVHQKERTHYINQGVAVIFVEAIDIINLPPQKEDVYYIVSDIVWTKSNRPDLLRPDAKYKKFTNDGSRKVISCARLVGKLNAKVNQDYLKEHKAKLNRKYLK